MLCQTLDNPLLQREPELRVDGKMLRTPLLPLWLCLPGFIAIGLGLHSL
jgi:hypothetical protein